MVRKIILLFLLSAYFSSIPAQGMKELHTCSHVKSKRSSYLNQRDSRFDYYDLIHANLFIKNNPDSLYIDGHVTYTLKCKKPLNQIVFALNNNMKVELVSYLGQALSFQHDSILEISLPVSFNTEDIFQLEISYNGVPEEGGLDTFKQEYHNEIPIVWTLSQPYGAKAWWPVKENLGDKFDSIQVQIQCPKTFTAVSNGLLVDSIIQNEWKTYIFKHNYPIPTYLVAFAITEYTYSNYTLQLSNGALEIENFLFTYDESQLLNEAKKVDGVLAYFDSLFIPYPFMNEKYAHAQFTRGGGMEHTTISFMGNFHLNLVVHELAHHWFGNYVTCNSWRDIWLNEGFATYCEGLYYEVLEEGKYLDTWLTHVLESATSYDTGSVYVYDTTEVSRVFDSKLSYTKAAYVLHQLRYQIGDEAFLSGIRNYLIDSNNAYSFSSTQNLQNHLEQSSNQDLSDYFNYFIYGEGYPIFSIDWKHSSNGITMEVSQENSARNTNWIPMKVPIKLIGFEGDTLIEIELKNEKNTFELNTNFRTRWIEFDPEKWILTKNPKIQGPAATDEVLLYPNPTSNAIYISTDFTAQYLSEVEVWDNTGQKFHHFVSENTSGKQFVEIPCQTWPNGLYIISFTTVSGKQETVKTMVAH